jgi:hypothetical protein
MTGLFTVIGVLPPGTPWLQLRRYLRADGSPPNADRGSFELAVIGRLVPGITTAAAQSDLNSVAARIAREYPQAKGMGVGSRPGDRMDRRHADPPRHVDSARRRRVAVADRVRESGESPADTRRRTHQGNGGSVGMLTGFASGLAPALQSPSLRETNRSQAGGSRSQTRMRGMLVAGE